MANSGSDRAGGEAPRQNHSSPRDADALGDVPGDPLGDPLGDPGGGDTPSHYREADEKSYGNMSDQHWSKTRGERNAEALDYYRDRSKAPGVEDGGEARNYYCMECDGVIPWDDFQGDECPHCGAEIEGSARRYFNWVEIDRTPKSDRTAMAIAVGILVAVLGTIAGLAVWLL